METGLKHLKRNRSHLEALRISDKTELYEGLNLFFKRKKHVYIGAREEVHAKETTVIKHDGQVRE